MISLLDERGLYCKHAVLVLLRARMGGFAPAICPSDPRLSQLTDPQPQAPKRPR